MILQSDEYLPHKNEEIEKFNIKKFSNKNIINSKIAINMMSIFSSATVGLNLPQLFYMHVSLNNFKPNKLNYPHCVKINNKFISNEYFNILNSLIQVIGRLTRRHENEKYAVRILHCKNQSPYKEMALFGLLIPSLKNVLKKLQLFN